MKKLSLINAPTTSVRTSTGMVCLILAASFILKHFILKRAFQFLPIVWVVSMVSCSKNASGWLTAIIRLTFSIVSYERKRYVPILIIRIYPGTEVQVGIMEMLPEVH